MSYDFASVRNKHPKVYFEQYLADTEEPQDDAPDSPPELEAELLENSFVMRRRFRSLAQKMRNRYS